MTKKINSPKGFRIDKTFFLGFAFVTDIEGNKGFDENINNIERAKIYCKYKNVSFIVMRPERDFSCHSEFFYYTS